MKNLLFVMTLSLIMNGIFPNFIFAQSGELINVSTKGIAIDGYDPVAFFTENKAVPGSMEFQSNCQGAIFQFASARNKEKFDNETLKYLPQYGGFCAVSASMGKIEPVSIETWSVEDGKLYFQRNAKALGMWNKKGPQMFIQKADKNWPVLVNRFGSPLTYKQVTESMDLTLEAAKTIAESGRQYAKENMAPGGAIAVVDSGGHLLYLQRLDGTFPAASKVAGEKAKTAAMFRFPSKKLEDGILGGRSSLITVGHNMLRGGVPIFFKGQTVGAIGVSGAASADQDVEIATFGSRTKFN